MIIINCYVYNFKDFVFLQKNSGTKFRASFV